MRSISGFNGSSTGGSFGAGEPVYASALNKLGTGIDQTRTMMSNDIQFNTATGGVVYSVPQDVTDGIGNNYVLPWTVQVYQEVQEDDTIKYFLRTARGICNYTWSEFPYGPSSGLNPSLPVLDPFGNSIYSNECIIKDYSIYPSGSYKIGTDTTGNSPWMAEDAAIEIKNAEDGGSDTWYVTVSKIDWWNKLGAKEGRIVDKERPFLSVYAAGSAAELAIDAFTGNSMSLHKMSIPMGFPPVPVSGSLYLGYVVPKWIGYDFKKVAWIGWNDTDKKWDVVQYILHQVELAIPYQEQTRWVDTLDGVPPGNEYKYAVEHDFVGFIDASSLSFLDTFGISNSGITDYTINLDNWWDDIVANTTAR